MREDKVPRFTNVYEAVWDKEGEARSTELIIARTLASAAAHFTEPEPSLVRHHNVATLVDGVHLVDHVLTPVAAPVFEIKTTAAKHRGKSYGQALHHAYMSGLPLITIKNVFMREDMGTIDALKALRNNMYRYRDGAPNALQDLADPPVGHYRKDAHWGAVEINLIKTRREAGDTFEQIGFIIGRHHLDVMEKHHKLTEVTAPPKCAKKADPHTDEAVYSAYVRGLSLENILATRAAETTMHALLVRLCKIVYVRRHDHEEAVGAEDEGSPTNGPYRGDAAWTLYEHALIRTRVTAGDSFIQVAFILGRTDKDVETQYLTFSDPPVEETDEKPAPMPANPEPTVDEETVTKNTYTALYNHYCDGANMRDLGQVTAIKTQREMLAMLRSLMYTFRDDMKGERAILAPRGAYRTDFNWSDLEEKLLATRYHAGDSDEKIGFVFGRSVPAVKAKRKMERLVRTRKTAIPTKVTEEPAKEPPVLRNAPKLRRLTGRALLGAYLDEKNGRSLEYLIKRLPAGQRTKDDLLLMLSVAVFEDRGDVPDKFPKYPGIYCKYRKGASVSRYEQRGIDHRKAMKDSDADITTVFGRAPKSTYGWKDRKPPKHVINPWFAHNDKNMLAAFRAGLTVKQVAKQIERSYQGVVCRMHTLLEGRLVPNDVIVQLRKLKFDLEDRYPKRNMK